MKRNMNLNQVGILLELSGTALVILVAGILLAPEIIGKRIPNYFIRFLTSFASRLRDLAPQQPITPIKKLSRPLVVGAILWLLVCLSVFFLISHYDNIILRVFGAVAVLLAILVVAFLTLPPLFWLEAAKIQSSIWDDGKFAPKEEKHISNISLLHRLKYVYLSFSVIFAITLLWPLSLLISFGLSLALVWRSATQFLATEKAPRLIALFIGITILFAGLIIELIGTF